MIGAVIIKDCENGVEPLEKPNLSDLRRGN
jgi:hypothetical protein